MNDKKQTQSNQIFLGAARALPNKSGHQSAALAADLTLSQRRQKVLDLIAQKHALVEILQVLNLNVSAAELNIIRYQMEISALFEVNSVVLALQDIQKQISILCQNLPTNGLDKKTK